MAVGVNPTPGLWMLGGARALVENSEPGVLATDFRACMAYGGAEAAAATVTAGRHRRSGADLLTASFIQ